MPNWQISALPVSLMIRKQADSIWARPFAAHCPIIVPKFSKSDHIIHSRPMSGPWAWCSMECWIINFLSNSKTSGGCFRLSWTGYGNIEKIEKTSYRERWEILYREFLSQTNLADPQWTTSCDIHGASHSMGHPNRSRIIEVSNQGPTSNQSQAWTVKELVQPEDWPGAHSPSLGALMKRTNKGGLLVVVHSRDCSSRIDELLRLLKKSLTSVLSTDRAWRSCTIFVSSPFCRCRIVHRACRLNCCGFLQSISLTSAGLTRSSTQCFNLSARWSSKPLYA